MSTVAQYFDTLKADAPRKAVVAALVNNMKGMGITNTFTQAGILSVVSKESDFKPKNEIPYRITPNNIIRNVFGNRVGMYNDTQLNNLKANDEAFFNAVYGGWYGNAANEGYKYRGRGYNQLTFKGNYLQIGNQIGVDLVNNPDLLNNVDIASKALIQFFKNKFSESNNKLYLYNSKSINDFKDLNNAVLASYHANAGWGNSISTDSTGGKALAVGRSTSFLDIVKQNPGTTGSIFFLISAATGAIIWKVNKRN
jgi:predicted chitinase